MDSILSLKHLSSLYYNLGFGFFVFGNFREMSEICGLFLLFAFGFKSFYSALFPTRIASDSGERSVKSNNIVLHSNDEIRERVNRKLPKRNSERISGSDVSALRKMVAMERRRAEAAGAELERERAASASAAEEAMAMIQRLQQEKSSIEMEFNQYRRLTEARRSHGEEMIQTLEWLVCRQEAEMSLLREDLRLLNASAHHI